MRRFFGKIFGTAINSTLAATFLLIMTALLWASLRPDDNEPFPRVTSASEILFETEDGQVRDWSGHSDLIDGFAQLRDGYSIRGRYPVGKPIKGILKIDGKEYRLNAEDLGENFRATLTRNPPDHAIWQGGKVAKLLFEDLMKPTASPR